MKQSPISNTSQQQARIHPLMPAITLSRRHQGFSLVELLAAIAVVAIIAAILISVLGNVRHSAEKSQCASNIRQLGAAVLMYNAEKGYLPPIVDFRTGGLGMWSWCLTEGGYVEPASEIWVCPTHAAESSIIVDRMDNVQGLAEKRFIETYPRSYSMCGSMVATSVPDEFSGNGYAYPMRVEKFNNPANTVLLADQHSDYAGVRYSPSSPPHMAVALERDRVNPDVEKAYLNTKHPNGERNFVFMDGHVEWMTPEEAYTGAYWNYWSGR